MTGKAEIKNIVFDLGVVLFDLDYQLTVQAFEELGVTNHEELFSEAGQLNLFDQFERGEINTPKFIAGMQGLLPERVNDNSIIEAWNAMLLGFPQTSIDLLNELRKHYKLYLLSNTNDLHFKCFHEMIDEEHGLKGLEQFFEGVYYSHKEGLRKPEARFYLRLLEEEGLNPSQTMFIDDLKRNVVGAEIVGMKAILLKKDMLVADLFDENFEFRS